MLVQHWDRYRREDSYTVHHASNVALERNANLIRAEFWATKQEYELQEEEFISLGLSKTVKLRFQLDMEPAPDNASNTGISEWVIASLDYAPDNATEVLTYANDRFGAVIQHVLQEAEN